MLQQLLVPVVTKAIINTGIVRRLSSLWEKDLELHLEQAASEVNKEKWSYVELDIIQGR